jgi:hypothetical protein
MTRLWYRRSLFVRGVVWGALFAFCWAAGSTARAQDEAPQLLMKYEPTGSNNYLEPDVIELRPNVKQPVYFYLKNPSREETIPSATVRLLQGKADEPGPVVATAEVRDLKPGKAALLRFSKAAPAAEKGAGAVPAKAGPAPWPALDGPPFALRFEVHVVRPEAKKGGGPEVKKTVRVRIRTPGEYVKPTKVVYNPATQAVEATVEADKAFTGPPCPVQLVLGADVVPGLKLHAGGGTYKDLLTEPGQKIKLRAEKLPFGENTPPPFDRVYLTVDDYERAFLYRSSFTAGDLEKLKPPRVDILAPRYVFPGPDVPVRVLVDAPGAPVKVELGLDRSGEGNFSPELLPGARKEEVSLLPAGPGGGVLFQTTVRPWDVKLDAADVYGTRAVRVRLLPWDVQAGTVNKGKPLALNKNEAGENEEDLWQGETLPVLQPNLPTPFARVETTSDNKAVEARIVLDGTPPEVGFVRPWPEDLKDIFRGDPLPVRAKARAGPSHIRRLVFYVGKPVRKGDEEEPPPTAVLVDGKRSDPKGTVWTADLPVDTAKPAHFYLTVQATNGAGKSSSETITIYLKDRPKEGGKGDKALAKVTGKVLVGGRPQAGVPVSLSDLQGTVKGATKTNKDGVYVFRDVPPGSYIVTAAQRNLNLRGETTVQVPAGEATVKDQDISLSR